MLYHSNVSAFLGHKIHQNVTCVVVWNYKCTILHQVANIGVTSLRQQLITETCNYKILHHYMYIYTFIFCLCL